MANGWWNMGKDSEKEGSSWKGGSKKKIKMKVHEMVALVLQVSLNGSLPFLPTASSQASEEATPHERGLATTPHLAAHSLPDSSITAELSCPRLSPLDNPSVPRGSQAEETTLAPWYQTWPLTKRINAP